MLRKRLRLGATLAELVLWRDLLDQCSRTFPTDIESRVLLLDISPSPNQFSCSLNDLE